MRTIWARIIVLQKTQYLENPVCSSLVNKVVAAGCLWVNIILGNHSSVAKQAAWLTQMDKCLIVHQMQYNSRIPAQNWSIWLTISQSPLSSLTQCIWESILHYQNCRMYHIYTQTGSTHRPLVNVAVTSIRKFHICSISIVYGKACAEGTPLIIVNIGSGYG